MARFDLNQMSDIGAPPSPEDAGSPMGGAPAQDDQNGKDPAYRGAEVRCYNCEYFKEPSNCSKGVNGGTVDPEGGCNLFEMADQGTESDEGEGEPSGGGQQ